MVVADQLQQDQEYLWGKFRKHSADGNLRTRSERKMLGCISFDPPTGLDNDTIKEDVLALAEELGLDTLASGVIILKVAQRSLARRFRFRKGDLILGVNKARIGLVSELVAVMKEPAADWQITMQRGGKVHTIRIGE